MVAFVALETGQSIADDAMAGAILRSLQFRVALTLDSDCLPQICARWADDVDRIQHPEARAVNRAMMWLSTGFAENTKVPLKPRLEAIIGIPTLPSEILTTYTDLCKRFFETANATEGLPDKLDNFPNDIPLCDSMRSRFGQSGYTLAVVG